VVSLTDMVNSGAASGETDTFVLQLSYSEAVLIGFEAAGAAMPQNFSWPSTTAPKGSTPVAGNSGGSPVYFRRDYLLGDEVLFCRWGINYSI
jgi:hypothetical protein